jgi:LPS export ABC transporter protein LptC
MKTIKNITHRFGCFKLFYLAVAVIGILVCCKNDIETIHALTNEVDLPDVTGFNIEISYTDSGILKGKIIAPEAIDYSRKDEPYTEFPKGMKVVFYDRAGNPESYIQANYAILYKKKQLWEGRNQVLAENPAKGEKLETEQIFWDQKAKQIYSEKYSTITNSDGVFYGENGFEAKEDLSKWWMKGYKGKVNIASEPVEDVQSP